MPPLVVGYEVSNKLASPFRLIVAGGSGSGKTELVKRMLREGDLERFDDIHYCYPNYLTEVPAEFSVTVQYHAGLMTTNELKYVRDGSLIIIDDLMMESSMDQDVAKLFTVVARKRRISIILLVQNIYQQGKYFRNIRLNSTGIIIFKFRAGRDVNKRLLRDLGLQDMISIDQLDRALAEKYSYILFDLHPDRHCDFGCVRSNIFDTNFSVFYKMEYVAITKADFLKYFKIIESKSGQIKAIKNEIEIKPKSDRKRKSERKPKSGKKRKQSDTECESATDESKSGESTEESEYTSESD